MCEGYTTRILDIPEAESQELLALLFAHVTQPRYVYRHKWRVDDLSRELESLEQYVSNDGPGG